jgi:hypothetical protein
VGILGRGRIDLGYYNRQPKVESEDNTLNEYQTILHDYIDKYGENKINNKLLEYERLNYPYDDCKNLYQKCEFLSDFIAFLEKIDLNI